MCVLSYLFIIIISTSGNNDGTSKEKYKPGAMGEIATAVIDEMQDAYPELDERRGVILELISREEAAFLQTLDQGLAILERSMRETEGPTMPPQIAVHLYTRLGFPLDLTAAIVQEHDKQLDLQAVEALLAEEKEKSKMHAFNFSREGSPRAPIRSRMSGGAASAFSGYEKVMEESAKVLGVESDENGLWLRIDPCPFYGLGGGQVGDRGYLEIDHGTQPFRLDISDTIAAPNSEGGLLFSPRKNLPQERIPSWLPEAVGSHVRAVVDSRHRDAVRVHHTATHLLHSALRRVLGANVVQAGSVVEADKLRFDFTYPEPLGDDQLRQIESLVRDCIAQDVRVQTQTLDLEDARRSGALSLFSEKYPSKVRVVQVPGVSNELCAGTKRALAYEYYKVILIHRHTRGTHRSAASFQNHPPSIRRSRHAQNRSCCWTGGRYLV
jgi:alanyl-tRNA synthetase